MFNYGRYFVFLVFNMKCQITKTPPDIFLVITKENIVSHIYIYKCTFVYSIYGQYEILVKRSIHYISVVFNLFRVTDYCLLKYIFTIQKKNNNILYE